MRMWCICDDVLVVRAGPRSIVLESVTHRTIRIQCGVVWAVAAVAAVIGRHGFG